METYREAMRKARREYLIAVMRTNGHVVSKAAYAAGYDRKGFYKLLAEFAPELVIPIQARRREQIQRRATQGNAAWKELDAPEARV